MTAVRALTGVLRNNAIELPVAAFAALAVAFVAFAAPADLLGELVGMTGLPAILSAAEPPLGATARTAIGVVGSGLVFALAFAALRGLDRVAARPASRPEPVLVTEEESPRLRRRDLHPDAPAVRPISATRDFGEPEGRVPAWLAEAAAPIAEEAAAPVAVPEVPEPRPTASENLTDLMARLEIGLARRRSAAPCRAAAAPEAYAPPSPSDDRLQSAIESLQRLTARQA